METCSVNSFELDATVSSYEPYYIKMKSLNQNSGGISLAIRLWKII